MVLQSFDSSMLVRGASCICLGSEANEKYRSTGDLGIVQAAREDVQCNMLAERGANKSDGWGLGRQLRSGPCDQLAGN